MRVVLSLELPEFILRAVFEGLPGFWRRRKFCNLSGTYIHTQTLMNLEAHTYIHTYNVTVSHLWKAHIYVIRNTYILHIYSTYYMHTYVHSYIHKQT